MTEGLRLPVYSQAKQAVGEVELSSAVFGQRPRAHLLYEAVKMQRANRRSGTHATKTRAFVSGGGKKPWRQKGTGRARQGSTRAPQWVGGATVFGPQPRDYSYRMPYQARRQALRVALSTKNREQSLIVVDRLEVATGKTRDLAKAINSLGAQSALVVVAGPDDNLERAARNLARIKVIRFDGLNVYDVLAHEHIILTRDALEGVEKRLSI